MLVIHLNEEKFLAAKQRVEMGFIVELDIPAYWHRARAIVKFPGCSNMYPAVPENKVVFTEDFPAILLMCGRQKYVTSISMLRVVQKEGALPFYRLNLRYIKNKELK